MPERDGKIRENWTKKRERTKRGVMYGEKKKGKAKEKKSDTRRENEKKKDAGLESEKKLEK